MTFQLNIRRTRWFTGYNSHLNPLIDEVRSELDEIMNKSHSPPVNAPFRTLELWLQFSDLDCKPKVHFIERRDLRLNVEAAVDWREHAKDDRLTLKVFFVSSVAECVLWVAREFGLPTESLEQTFAAEKIRPSTIIVDGGFLQETILAGVKKIRPSTVIVGDGAVQESVFRYKNELQIAVKLSNEEFGTEDEIERCQKLAIELTERGADEDGTLAGGGFYEIYFKSEDPRQLYADIGTMLRAKRLRRGSYVVAKYLSGLYVEYDRFEIS
jgi:hypothetical protein